MGENCKCTREDQILDHSVKLAKQDVIIERMDKIISGNDGNGGMYKVSIENSENIKHLMKVSADTLSSVEVLRTSISAVAKTQSEMKSEKDGEEKMRKRFQWAIGIGSPLIVGLLIYILTN